MSEGINRVILVGNLGADPELRFTQAGQAVMNLRLATTESFFNKAKEQREERTEWHSVVVWGKRAEGLAKFLKKGFTLMIEGSLRTSSYEDREGNKRYKVEIVATNVIPLGGENAGSRGGAREGEGKPGAGQTPAADDYPDEFP